VDENNWSRLPGLPGLQGEQQQQQQQQLRMLTLLQQAAASSSSSSKQQAAAAASSKQQLRMLTLLQQAAAAAAAAAAEDANPAAASSSDESNNEPEPAQPPPPTPLSAKEFWGEATRLGAQYRFGGWVKVAELVMAMVPGPVEDERIFSMLKYIRNPQRNRLHAQHLTSCARVFKSSAFSVESLTYLQAILEWLSAKKRCGIV